MAITFPSDGLIIRYEKPTLPDPESAFQNMTKDMPGSRVVYLNGGSLPALSIPQVESDWGSITFVSGAATIVVMGHNDEATLERVAQSILDRSAA